MRALLAKFRIVFAAVAVLGMLVGSTITASPPANAANPTLEGTVRDESTNAVIPGICVYIANGSSNGWSVHVTDSNGHWQSNVTGAVVVDFFQSPSCGTQSVGYAEEYWNNVTCDYHLWYFCATPTNTTGSTITMNASLRQNTGGLQGTLTDDATGSGIGGVCVSAVNVADEGTHYSATSAGDGAWAMSPMLEGNYRVRFDSACNGGNTYAPEYWDNAYTLDAATLAGVSAGANTRLDAGLAAGGTIRGVVTDRDGNNLRGACVRAYGPQGDFYDAVTNSVGAYQVRHLPAGSYDVRFRSCNPGFHYAFAEEWWERSPDRSGAAAVEVPANTIVNDINPAVLLTGGISGRVVDDTGKPVAGICVQAIDAGTGGVAGTTQSQSNGNYLVGLSEGEYSLYFSRCSPDEQPSAYYPTYYPTGASAGDAEHFGVGSDVVSGIEVALTPAAQITGRILGQRVFGGGVIALQGSCAEIYDANANLLASYATDAFGRYTTFPMDAGTYRVFAWDCTGGWAEGAYRPQWNNGGGNFDYAAPLVIAAGESRDVSFVLQQSNNEGLVLGKVERESSAVHPSGICVDGHLTPGSFTYRTQTDSAGRYFFMLPNNLDFRLFMHDCNTTPTYLPVWYTFGNDLNNPAHTYNSASALEALSTTALRLYDHGSSYDTQRLTPGGSFTGTIINAATNQPIAGICIYAGTTTMGAPQGSTTTASNGTWSIPGLDPYVQYTVTLNSCADPAWQVISIPNMQVPLGGASTNGGGVLRPRGAISGTVAWSEGAGAPTPTGTGVCVTAYDSGGNAVATDETNSSSQYLVGPLPDGAYKVKFTDCDGSHGYVTEWWNDATSSASATPITIASRNEVTSISPTLARGFSVSFDVPAVDELDPGELSAAVVRIRRPASASATSVKWTTISGTAGAYDFSYMSDVANFAPGETEKAYNIYVIGDALTEPTEQFSVVLHEAAGSTVVNRSATLLINDSDHYGYLRATTSPALPSQLSLDGVPMDTWGLTWVRVEVGDHQLCFGDVAGHTTPACRTVTITEGTTTTSVGNFAQNGFLRVTTNPALPVTITVDGTPRNDWGMWTDLPVGAHQVCFGSIDGYATPACQNVNLTAGDTTTIAGNYVAGDAACSPCAPKGFLRVTTTPALPSQISIDGVPADSWGLTWVELTPGRHEISFSDVAGYTTPPPQTALITAGDTTVVDGAFSARGFLRAITNPAAASTVFVDGAPRNDWGMWTDVPVGTHKVCFGPVGAITDLAAASCRDVNVTAGATATTTWNVPAAPTSAVTKWISLGSDGAPLTGAHTDGVVSDNGRYVAFVSSSKEIGYANPNGYPRVYLRDNQTGTTHAISPGPGQGMRPRISRDGLSVVWDDGSSIYVTSTQTLVTRQVVNAPNSYAADISGDGNVIAFVSTANNLVPGDTNNKPDVFVLSLVGGGPVRASVGTGNAQGSGDIFGSPRLDATGANVVFSSSSPEYMPPDNSNNFDVFVHNVTSAITYKVSSGSGHNFDPVISMDGRYVAFRNPSGVVRYDMQSAQTAPVSVDGAGNLMFAYGPPAISANGQYVAFGSAAIGFPGNPNTAGDVYVRNMLTNTTRIVSVGPGGTWGNGGSGFPTMSSDGRYIAFYTDSGNWLPGDWNGATDVWLRDMTT